MTLREALERASAVLKEAGVPDASRDAFLLLNHVTGINHAVYPRSLRAWYARSTGVY